MQMFLIFSCGVYEKFEFKMFKSRFLIKYQNITRRSEHAYVLLQYKINAV